jgi:hypothetical protein
MSGSGNTGVSAHQRPQFWQRENTKQAQRGRRTHFFTRLKKVVCNFFTRLKKKWGEKD